MESNWKMCWFHPYPPWVKKWIIAEGMGMIPLNIFISWVMSFWSQTDLWPQKPGAKLSSGDLPLSAFTTYHAENFLHFSVCWIFSFLSPKCFSLSYCFLVLLVHLPTKKGCMLDVFLRVVRVWKCSYTMITFYW